MRSDGIAFLVKNYPKLSKNGTGWSENGHKRNKLEVFIRLLGGSYRWVGAVIALLADLLQFGLEVGIGEGAGVLEVAQAGIGEDVEVAIGDECFEGSAAVIGLIMLCAGEPAQEVVRAVVQKVFDEMMTDADIGLTISVEECRSVTVEDLAHEGMAGPGSEMTHARCVVPPFRLFFTVAGGIDMR